MPSLPRIRYYVQFATESCWCPAFGTLSSSSLVSCLHGERRPRPVQQHSQFCQLPVELVEPSNWNFACPLHLTPQTCFTLDTCKSVFQTPKQIMPNELPVRGQRGTKSVDSSCRLLMQPIALQSITRATELLAGNKHFLWYTQSSHSEGQ